MEKCFLESGVPADKQQPFIAAQHDFLDRHLAIWIPKFCAGVRKADPDGPYGFLASFLETFIAADVRYISSLTERRLNE